MLLHAYISSVKRFSGKSARSVLVAAHAGIFHTALLSRGMRVTEKVLDTEIMEPVKSGELRSIVEGETFDVTVAASRPEAL